jgi:hypothetical protein
VGGSTETWLALNRGGYGDCLHPRPFLAPSRRQSCLGSRGEWMARGPVPGHETASLTPASPRSRRRGDACGRPTPLQAAQACCPGDERALPCLPSLRRVQSRGGHREVPHPWLSIPRVEQLPASMVANWTHGPWLPRAPRGWRAVQVHSLSWGMASRGLPQEGPALRQLLRAHPVGQEATVAPPVKAVRRDVQPQTAQQLHRIACQGAPAVAVLVVLRAQGPLAVLQRQEPVVGAGPTRGRTGQGREHILGVLPGLFGVDHPRLVAQGGEEAPPRRGRSELPTATHQGELALRVGLRQTGEGEAPEAPREAADGQAEVRPTREPLGPLGRQAPGGEDPRQMGVLVPWLAPGVEHGQAAALRPEMLGVPGDGLERLGDRAKEEAREAARVLQRPRPKVVRQGKEAMRVGRLEECALPGREPGGLGGAMACGATAVPARGVRLPRVAPVMARGNGPSEGGGPARGDGPQGAVLLAREGGPRAGQQGGTMSAHHSGACEWWATQGSWSRWAGNARASRGLFGACSAGWATGK